METESIRTDEPSSARVSSDVRRRSPPRPRDFLTAAPRSAGSRRRCHRSAYHRRDFHACDEFSRASTSGSSYQFRSVPYLIDGISGSPGPLAFAALFLALSLLFPVIRVTDPDDRNSFATPRRWKPSGGRRGRGTDFAVTGLIEKRRAFRAGGLYKSFINNCNRDVVTIAARATFLAWNNLPMSLATNCKGRWR